MTRGISTNLSTTSQAACLKQKGIDFVFRYYSSTTTQPQKRLTQAEADALSAAGITVGVVYEDGPTAAEYFSSQRGHQDGSNALAFAQAINQPPGSAIYFAVDYDASTDDVSGPILDYFNGVDKGLKDASVGISNYVVGVYGSGAVCDFIKTECAFVRFSWMAESTGWRGSKTYASWDVNQAIATSDLCDFATDEYEENQALDNFGGFVTAQPPLSSIT